MQNINFNQVTSYEKLQDIVFLELTIPYNQILEKYDLELAYQNKNNKNFKFIDIIKNIEEKKQYLPKETEIIKMADEAESSMTDVGNKRTRFEFNTPPLAGIEEDVGRPIRRPTRLTPTDVIGEEKYAGRGKILDVEKVNLPQAYQNGSVLTIYLNNPQLWEQTINRWEADAARAWLNSDKKADMFAYLERNASILSTPSHYVLLGLLHSVIP